MHLRRLIAVALFGAALAGCQAAPPPPPVAVRPPPFTQTGLASWYGPHFVGKVAADGERFDGHALTAAHRTLPLGTMARVTNLENGRSVIVRITDRGPYARNRILDLSAKAASEIGMTHDGVVRVRIEVIDTNVDSKQAAD